MYVLVECGCADCGDEPIMELRGTFASKEKAKVVATELHLASYKDPKWADELSWHVAENGDESCLLGHSGGFLIALVV